MSKVIKDRNPDQCRSNHQKMMKFHKNLEGIIQNLKTRLNKSDNGE